MKPRAYRDDDPALDQLKLFITSQPRLTEADQAQLLTSLIAAETSWRADAISLNGVERLYAPLAKENLKNVAGKLFRLRQAGQLMFTDLVRGARWEEIAKIGINARFITWAKHISPSQLMFQLEADIIALGQKLATSLLALVLRQARTFKFASKTNYATVPDLVAIGVEGVMSAVCKYQPANGVVSARVFKSTALGRISGAFGMFSRAQTVAHLTDADSERLLALRAGRVPEADITDDDRMLLDVGNFATLQTVASAYEDHDGRTIGFDLADPSPNAEQMLILREDAQEREQKVAEWHAAQEAERAAKKAERQRKRASIRRRAPRPEHAKVQRKPVRDVNTGETWVSGVAAAAAIGCTASAVSSAIARGALCKGRWLEQVGKPRRPKPTAGRKVQRKPVRDRDTGEVFSSAQAAAKAIGTAQSNLHYALNAGRACKGRWLEYVTPVTPSP